MGQPYWLETLTRNPAPLVHPAGEDWYMINQSTGKHTLQSGMVNAVICLKTGKAQEYPNLVKGSKKHKYKKGIHNDTNQLFQGIGDIKGTNTCLLIYNNGVPQGAKVT